MTFFKQMLFSTTAVGLVVHSINNRSLRWHGDSPMAVARGLHRRIETIAPLEANDA